MSKFTSFNKFLKILKEIGHPCIIAENMSDQLELRTEPITPLKLVELLLK